MGFEAVVPNPKLKLLDQVREVLRLKHYSIRTERSYCGKGSNRRLEFELCAWFKASPGVV